jgi:hypothetical protein
MGENMIDKYLQYNNNKRNIYSGEIIWAEFKKKCGYS